jgi:putative peptide zinc metalloprotease protein
VSGLVTGVWRAGWPSRLLLAAVVAGLAAPLVYAAAGWLAGRSRAVRRWWAGRRVAADLPRRRELLRGSSLGGLPAAQLDRLAAQARWLHPRSGTPLVPAGTPHREVLVVADGAVEGRRPGDPGGTVRQRVGPGGVVGLAAALSGAPATLSWYTAGTTLLAVPAPVAASTLGGWVGPAADRAEAEQLFAETPGLAGLSEDEQAWLVARGRPVSIRPGSPVPPPAPHEAMVVASGVVVQPDGTELRRGSVVLPPADAEPPAGTARAWVRLWLVPVVPVVTAGWPGGPPAGSAPRYGVHPAQSYPPLAVPPGPPPPELDRGADQRFERRLRWLVLLLLLLALLLGGSQLLAGPAWSEMPEDRVLLTVARGPAEATLDGEPVRVRPGGRHYLAAGDRVEVGPGSLGRLTLHGGSVVLLCAGSTVTVGPIGSDGVRPVAPAGELDLATGTVLLDTASASAVYVPAALTVHTAGRTVANQGEAWYAVGPPGLRVALGTVALDGAAVRPTGEALTCGDGVPVERPVGSSRDRPGAAPAPSTLAPPTAPPTPTPTAGPTATASPSPSPSPSPTPGPATGGPGSPEPSDPADPPPPPPPPTTGGPTTSPPPPPDRIPPAISRIFSDHQTIFAVIVTSDGPVPCQEGPMVTWLRAAVTDPTDEPDELLVTATVHLGEALAYDGELGYDGTFFSVQLGPFGEDLFSIRQNPVHVVVRATDPAGNLVETKADGFLTLIDCPER